MAQHRIPAVFMRGGTSNAVVFNRNDLPADPAEWDAIFLSVMGSPDPNGRQLDGMGGGISSLSKVCIVGPSTHGDADVDYLFAQIPIKGVKVDYSGNCGNMSSAIGPFAVMAGLVEAPPDGEAVVRIHNINTSKIIVSRFGMAEGAPETEGDLAIDGVAGEAAPIRLEFLAPGGAKTGKLLPTGRAVDTLDVPGLGPIEASLVDAANPCVFVRASDLGMRGTELPGDLDGDEAFLAHMESIRRAASVAMGIAPSLQAAGAIESVPKVAMVSVPQPAPVLSGAELAPGDMSIVVRMISVGQPHRAVPITGAICLSIACRIEGSIPNGLSSAGEEPIRVAHPSGVVLVDAAVDGADTPGTANARFGAVYRTARLMFEGAAYYRPLAARDLERAVEEPRAAAE